MNYLVESPGVSDSNRSENFVEDPLQAGPSRPQKTAPAEKPKRKRRRRKQIYNPAGSSKSLRRIKRLGYTPEQNKRGYKYAKKAIKEDAIGPGTVPPEAGVEAPPLVLDPDSRIVQVDVEYDCAQTKKQSRVAPNNRDGSKRAYTYVRVNGKSVRYLNETEAEEVQRRAMYIRRNRKYKENETEEQHRERLERRRARCREKYAQRRKALEALTGPKVPKVRKPKTAPVKPARKPRVAVDLEKLTGIQREYAEFKIYVAEKLQEARERQQQLGTAEQGMRISKPRTRRRKATTPRKTPLPDTESVNLKEPQPSTILITNDIPVDPEIALLETSDQTFVPVQVICQTCDDFDDMLEIENV